MNYGIRTKIQAVVGMHSLVGIGKSEYPKSFGNYFSFWTSRKDAIDGTSIRCVNMWSENLEEARKRFFDDGLVEGVLFTQEEEEYTQRWFVVDDPRLPSKEWLHNKFCWTGTCAPRNKEVIREMYSIHGDPENELERFLDPKTYHAKRGGEYITTKDGFSCVKYNVKAEARKLKDDWTIEVSKDVIGVFGVDMLENILSDPNTPEDDL